MMGGKKIAINNGSMIIQSRPGGTRDNFYLDHEN